MKTIAELLLASLEWQAKFEKIECTPDWPSPCVILPADNDELEHWRPAPISDKTVFDKLELRTELSEFFTSYFGKSIRANHSGETCIIHASWNQQELESTASDVSLMLSEEIPICIATTDSDLFFGACNKTGTIWLCEPGYPPIRKVSESLHDFLSET